MIESPNVTFKWASDLPGLAQFPHSFIESETTGLRTRFKAFCNAEPLYPKVPNSTHCSNA